MPSATVHAERRLRKRLRELAAEHLGTDARADAVEALADEWYDGPRRRRPDPETPVQRWRRDTVQRETRKHVRAMQARCS